MRRGFSLLSFIMIVNVNSRHKARDASKSNHLIIRNVIRTKHFKNASSNSNNGRVLFRNNSLDILARNINNIRRRHLDQHRKNIQNQNNTSLLRHQIYNKLSKN